MTAHLHTHRPPCFVRGVPPHPSTGVFWAAGHGEEGGAWRGLPGLCGVNPLEQRRGLPGLCGVNPWSGGVDSRGLKGVAGAQVVGRTLSMEAALGLEGGGGSLSPRPAGRRRWSGRSASKARESRSMTLVFGALGRGGAGQSRCRRGSTAGEPGYRQRRKVWRGRRMQGSRGRAGGRRRREVARCSERGKFPSASAMGPRAGALPAVVEARGSEQQRPGSRVTTAMEAGARAWRRRRGRWCGGSARDW